MLTQRLSGDGGNALEKMKRGLYVEDNGEEIRFVVQFDQGASQGELVIPLTLGQASRLMFTLRKVIESRRQAHAKKLPMKVFECKSGKNHA